MAIVVAERPEGRRVLGGRSARREYVIRGAAGDDVAAFNALISDPGVPAAIATDLASLIRINVNCEVTALGNGDFEASVPYAVPDWSFQAVNSFHLSFDISGQSQKITQSLSTVNSYAITTWSKRDFKGAINVSEEASTRTVDGCEIIIPAMVHTINYTFGNSVVTDAWIRTVAGVVGTVNNDTWHGFNPGECLLCRVSGQRREDTLWDISFGSNISYNRTGLQVGDITGITKDGWDYLWVFYGQKEVPDSAGQTRLQPVPVQANVERVYQRTAYGTTLGI